MRQHAESDPMSVVAHIDQAIASTNRLTEDWKSRDGQKSVPASAPVSHGQYAEKIVRWYANNRLPEQTPRLRDEL
jgi:hypothetical protein